MAPAAVGSIVETAAASWTFANDIEITLEANPSSVEATRFAGYRTAGVNRVSLGVQALNDVDLKRLGRLHSVEDALAAVRVGRSTFERVNIDLIYARQDQDWREWRAELREALSLGLDHYALYQLTIEDGTAFGDRFSRGRLPGLPDEDRAIALWEVTQEACETAGLSGYEVSNHAKSGQASRHNLTYWRGGDWVGVGPGAHGRLTIQDRRISVSAIRAPGSWLNSVRQNQSGDGELEVLDHMAWRDEYVLMGLRMTEGIDLGRIRSIVPDAGRLDARFLIQQGYLQQEGDRLWVTRLGRPLLNSIIAELLIF